MLQYRITQLFEDFLIGLFDLRGLVDAEVWTFFWNSASAVANYLMIIDTNDSHTPAKISTIGAS